MRRTIALLPLSLLTGAALATSEPVLAQLQDAKASDAKVVGHVLQPHKPLAPAQLLNVFARDLENPRMLAVAQDGAEAPTLPLQPSPAEGANGEQANVQQSAPQQLTREVLARELPSLELSSGAIPPGESIPAEHAADGQNISPPLSWEAGPQGTQSYVIMVEDSDVRDRPPFVHWLLYNVPAGTTQLDEAVPGTPTLAAPKDALQGRNDHGTVGYYGPRPPKKDRAHHYHFQVFALDRVLDLPPGASRAELIDAMRGHVLASGELVGSFER